MAGTYGLTEKILNGVSRQIIVYKVERDKFRYTSVDIHALENGTKISIKDNIKSLKDVDDIRKVDN